jgi:hypothetical protein
VRFDLCVSVSLWFVFRLDSAETLKDGFTMLG